MSQPQNPWSETNPSRTGQGTSPALPRGGMPAWGWALLGCGGMFFLIISILAAILFPVFAQAREKARQTSCLANLRQQSNALQMYAADFDGILPPASKWMDALYPYTGTESIFRCPTARSSAPTGYGYAFNDGVSQKSVAKIGAPETVITLYDSSTLTKNAHDALTSLPVPGRHSHGNNLVYADGHAKYKKDAPTP